MQFEKRKSGTTTYALIRSDEVILKDVQSALDLMVNTQYQLDIDRIAIDKKAVAEDFFILSTGLAGDILQKFVNYGVRLAIFGDFSRYTSKPLKDFIYESNHGEHVFFASTEAEAAAMLSKV